MPPPGLLALLPGVHSGDLVDVVGRSPLVRRVLVIRLRRIVVVRRRATPCRLFLLSALVCRCMACASYCSCCFSRSDRGYQILLLAVRDLRNLLFLPRLSAVSVPTLIFFFSISCLPHYIWAEESSRAIPATSSTSLSTSLLPNLMHWPRALPPTGAGGVS